MVFKEKFQYEKKQTLELFILSINYEILVMCPPQCGASSLPNLIVVEHRPP
jgi:hypothetical protein